MSNTGFPQTKPLMGNGDFSIAWRMFFQNLYQQTSGAATIVAGNVRFTPDGNVTTGDVQAAIHQLDTLTTKAAVVPNTAPGAGQVLVGNGAAYVPVGVSGDGALSSAGALSVSKIGGKSVTLAGNLTTAGAFASTFTMTGVTSVTFPTSGTLATVNATTAGGGTVTQTLNKTTGVTLNAATGQITLNNQSIPAGAVMFFTLTNSAIAAKDIVVPQLVSGYATAGTYNVWTELTAAGSVVIAVRNISAGALGEALVIGFAVLKSVTA